MDYSNYEEDVTVNVHLPSQENNNSKEELAKRIKTLLQGVKAMKDTDIKPQKYDPKDEFTVDDEDFCEDCCDCDCAEDYYECSVEFGEQLIKKTKKLRKFLKEQDCEDLVIQVTADSITVLTTDMYLKEKED